MAAKKPLVLYSGQVSQLQAGDTLDASASEVDVFTATNGGVDGLIEGEPVYISADNTVQRGRANAAGTTRAIALCKAAVAASGTGTFQSNGQATLTTAQWDSVTGQTGGLTPGAVYYLSSATAGRLTTTAPTSGYVVVVGTGMSTTTMDLKPREPIAL